MVCEGNWQGAESDPALLQELIEEELTAGFIEEVDSIEEAYKRWGKDRVAVGRVNIVKAPGRSPRLVVDNSICNTNQNCKVPEQFSLPCLQDIQASYPLTEDNEPVSGFSLDVKGAHKTSRVREQDRGLLGLRQQDRLFFYKVPLRGHFLIPTGFATLGGFFTRCLPLAYLASARSASVRGRPAVISERQGAPTFSLLDAGILFMLSRPT